MYESFFGLKHAPFRITPDINAFFGGGKREELINALLYTINRGEGIVKVVGEVGSGKTTLLRALASRLQESAVKLVYINSPNMSALDILLFICRELEVPYQLDEPKFVLVERLQQRLLQAHAEATSVVILIDEAQAMPQETLEEVRLLSNLETDSDKLLQIVLFGQPELDKALDQPEVRQIRDRIAFSLQLAPFSKDELRAYLNFRLRKAGYIGNDLFNSAVVRKIYRYTQGYPRRVNLLADKVMLAAFTANARQLSPRFVKQVEHERSINNGINLAYWTGGLILVLLVAWLAYMLLPAVQKAEPLEELGATFGAGTEKTTALRTDFHWRHTNLQTLDWVRGSLTTGERYTIQLMTVTRSQALAFMKLAPVEMQSKLQLFGYERDNQQAAVLLFGEFVSQQKARNALQRLPPVDSVALRPFIRALSDIDTELRQLLDSQKT